MTYSWDNWGTVSIRVDLLYHKRRYNGEIPNLLLFFKLFNYYFNISKYNAVYIKMFFLGKPRKHRGKT